MRMMTLVECVNDDANDPALTVMTGMGEGGFLELKKRES